MNFVRKAAVFTSSLLFVFLLFATASFAVMNATIGNPTKLKAWVNDTGVYETFTDGAMRQIESTGQASSENKGLPLDDPQVQKIIKDAFPPQLLQHSAEAVIDGTYRWLDGTASAPDFRIDLTEAKQQFANELGGYAIQRYNGLPTCSPNEIPSEFDPFNATCRVAGFDADAQAQQIIDKLATSPELFGEQAVITADSLMQSKPQSSSEAVGPNTSSQSQENTPAQTPFERLNYVPTVYQFGKFAPFIFGLLAIVAAGTIIFGSKDKRRGLRKVSIGLLTAGSLLVIGSFTNALLLERLATKGADSPQKTDLSGVIQNTVTTLVARFSEEANRLNIQFGSMLIILAAAVFIILIISGRKKLSKQDDLKPDRSTTENPASPESTQAQTAPKFHDTNDTNDIQTKQTDGNDAGDSASKNKE